LLLSLLHMLWQLRLLLLHMLRQPLLPALQARAHMALTAPPLWTWQLVRLPLRSLQALWLLLLWGLQLLALWWRGHLWQLRLRALRLLALRALWLLALWCQWLGHLCELPR
jgi:hypothetical protein